MAAFERQLVMADKQLADFREANKKISDLLKHLKQAGRPQEREWIGKIKRTERVLQHPNRFQITWDDAEVRKNFENLKIQLSEIQKKISETFKEIISGITSAVKLAHTLSSFLIDRVLADWKENQRWFHIGPVFKRAEVYGQLDQLDSRFEGFYANIGYLMDHLIVDEELRNDESAATVLHFQEELTKLLEWFAIRSVVQSIQPPTFVVTSPLREKRGKAEKQEQKLKSANPRNREPRSHQPLQLEFRMLGGQTFGFWHRSNVHKPSTVKITIINEDDASRSRSPCAHMEEHFTEVGELSKNCVDFFQCPYDKGSRYTAQFPPTLAINSIKEEEEKLRKSKPIKRRNEKSPLKDTVAKKRRYFFYCQCFFPLTHTVLQKDLTLSLLSLPFAILTHQADQADYADACITWSLMARNVYGQAWLQDIPSDGNDLPGQLTGRVLRCQVSTETLAEGLNLKFMQLIEPKMKKKNAKSGAAADHQQEFQPGFPIKELSQESKQYLVSKLCPNGIPVNITWEQFCELPVSREKDEKTFWQWFTEHAKLVQEHMFIPWNRGLILGFAEKEQMENLLMQSPLQSLLAIKFSDSEAGALIVGYRKPETGQAVGYRALSKENWSNYTLAEIIRERTPELVGIETIVVDTYPNRHVKELEEGNREQKTSLFEPHPNIKYALAILPDALNFITFPPAPPQLIQLWNAIREEDEENDHQAQQSSSAGHTSGNTNGNMSYVQTFRGDEQQQNSDQTTQQNLPVNQTSDGNVDEMDISDFQ